MSTEPGLSAPAGTQLHFRGFDLEGDLTGNLPSLEITGEQSAMFPWDIQESTIIEMCLDVPGTDSDFQLSTDIQESTIIEMCLDVPGTDSDFQLIAIGDLQKGNNVQWSDEAFADVIRWRRPSAWSDSGP